MATTRLTNNIRESLCKKLMHRAFNERAQDVIDDCADFAHRLYRDAMGRDRLKIIEKLPDGWLPTTERVKVVFGGEHTEVRLSGSLESWGRSNEFASAGAKLVTEGEKLPIPRKMVDSVLKQYEPDHKLTVERVKLVDRKDELEAEIRSAERTAMNAMNSVTTVKKLIEVWPEVEEFAKTYLVDGDRKAVLPSIPRQELNTALGLPPSKKELEKA